MTRLERVVVTGGGTAGHVFTGLGILDAVVRHHPAARTTFIGGTTGHEGRLVPLSAHRFIPVDIRPLRAHGPLARAGALVRIPRGVWQCVRLLKGIEPDVVLGIGGAASGPALLAARILGIPTALHEQNRLPGLANRLSGRFVDRIFIGLPQAGGAFDGDARVSLTGNPIREELRAIFAEPMKSACRDGSAKSPFSLLVLGGSDGSPFINAALPGALRRVAEATGFHLDVRHQAGPSDLGSIEAAYVHPRVRAQVAPFFADMGHLYRSTDLAVTPGGAVTLAELAHAGLGAVVVPFGASADDHQRRNAEYFSAHRAVVTLDEVSWRETEAASVIGGLLADAAARIGLGQAARTLAMPNAAASIVAGLEDLVRSERRPSSTRR